MAQGVKNPPAVQEGEEMGLKPGVGIPPGERRGNPVQCSRLEKKPKDRGVWWATVHGVAKSQARLND